MSKHRKDNSRLRSATYDIGYGRPPTSGQAKPGQVLNPYGRKGKPKPAPDVNDRMLAAIERNLRRRIPGPNGKPMAVQECMMQKAVYQILADNGDSFKAGRTITAIQGLIKLRNELGRGRSSTQRVLSSEDDEKALDQFMAEEIQRRAVKARKHSETDQPPPIDEREDEND